MKVINLVALGMVAVFISACSSAPMGTAGVGSGSNYTPVIDGPKDEKYYEDLRACRDLAYQVQSSKKQGAAKDALAGAFIGALIGSGEDKKAARDGALIGGAIGGLGANGEAASSAKTIMSRCMSGRGYNVLM